MMSFDYLHVFGLISLASYFLYTFGQFFKFRTKVLVQFSHLTLIVGIVANLVVLFTLFSSDVLVTHDSYVLESHPALIVLSVAFTCYLYTLLQKQKNQLYIKICSVVSFFIYSLGSVLLHNVSANKIYPVSMGLLLHIIFSLGAQVLLIVVCILSISLIIIHCALKSNMSLNKVVKQDSQNTSGMVPDPTTDVVRLPALIPTQLVWQQAITYAILFYCLSILSGLLQLGGLKYSEKIFFASFNLVGLLFAYVSFRFSKLSMFSITSFLSLYIAVVFTLQILFRGELFKF